MLFEKELYESVRDDPTTRPSGGAELAAFNQKKTWTFGLLKLSLETNVLQLVKHCRSAYEIWAGLIRLYDKPTWTRRMTLLQKFHSLVMAEGTSVGEHIAAMRSIVNELAGLGMDLTEELQVIQLLNSLPQSYSQLLVALQNVQVPGHTGLPGGLSAPPVSPAMRLPFGSPAEATAPRVAAASSGSGVSASRALGVPVPPTASEWIDFDAARPPQPCPLSLAYVIEALFQEEERRVRSGESVLAVGPRGTNFSGAG